MQFFISQHTSQPETHQNRPDDKVLIPSDQIDTAGWAFQHPGDPLLRSLPHQG